MGTRVQIKSLFSQANVYTMVALLFMVRRNLFGEFSLIGRALYVLFFVLSIYYFFETNFKLSIPAPLKALNLLILLIVIYGGVVAAKGLDNYWIRTTGRYFFLKIHLQSILPIYAFYYFAKKQQIGPQWFRIIAIFYFITAYILYVSNSVTMMEVRGTEEIVNNDAYLWLGLLPIICFFEKNQIVRNIGLLLIMYFILMGFKRGAIVIGVICYLIIFWSSMRLVKNNRKITTIVVLCIGLLIIVQFIKNIIVNNTLFRVRLEAMLGGDSSGRDVLFENYWLFFKRQNDIVSYIFGNGAFGTLKHLGLMAHNDWLEFLIDMGLLGILVYFIYWIRNFKMCIKSSRICPYEVYMCIVLSVIINFGRTFFSMSIMSMPFYVTSMFGYCLAIYDNNLKNPISK